MKTIELNKNEKILWVDIFKGILIVFMVIGHTGSHLTPYIYLFHMPAFIFISGYTSCLSKYKYFEYIKKKIITILLPFFITNIIFILFYSVLKIIDIYQYFNTEEYSSFTINIKRLLINGYTPDLGGATWFLLVLFAIEVFVKSFYDISIKCSNPRIFPVLIAIIVFIGNYLVYYKIFLPWLLDLCFYGILYFYLGIFARKNEILTNKVAPSTMYIFSIIVIIFFGSSFVPKMNWPTRDFEGPFINLLTSMCGIYILYRFSNFLINSRIFTKIFEFIGQRTYCILTTHFLAFKIVFGIFIATGIFTLDYLTQLTPRYSSFPILLVIALSSVAICLSWSWLASKNRIFDYIINAKPINYSIKTWR